MRTYNIPIFVPHRGCPYDCVFCNQTRITGSTTDVTPSDVQKIISTALKTLPKENRYVEAAFFGGSFTGIPMDEQSALLEAAEEFHEELNGIRLSTRPDYITTEILDNLQNHGVTTIELGVQSMDEEVLSASNRGHTKEQVTEAVRLIRKYPFTLGLQMMTGLPGDTPEKSLKTADEIIALHPEIVRIYPTLTIKDTYLEKMYADGRYKPESLEEAVELSKKLLLKFEANNIKVIRIGLQATEEICEEGSVVAGPVHSAFRELVEGAIYYDLIEKKLQKFSKKSNVKVFVNDKEISKAVGNKRINVKRIKEKFDINIKIKGNSKLKKREVICDCC